MTASAASSRIGGRTAIAQKIAHVQWRLKRLRADRADRSRRPFTYIHPVLARFVYHPGDYLSRRIFLYDEFEHAELAFAIAHACAGGTVVDVGANIGLYVAACAAAAGRRGRVVALEPGVETVRRLHVTCARLHLPHVSVLQAAAGSQPGTATLVGAPGSRDVHQHLADARPASAASATVVDVVRIDDVCDGPADVCLMKVDVEGHEVAALEGASQVLANGRVALIVEFYPSGLAAAGSSAAALWALLERTHACLEIVRPDGSVTPPDRHEIERLSGDETVNTLWLPRPRTS